MVSSAVRRAQWALHRRAALACTAAAEAGVPGRFRVWEEAGLMAVLATDPALGFLSTVSGVGPETVAAAVELARGPVWDGVRPTVVTASGDLTGAGLARTNDRVLAVTELVGRPEPDPGVVGTEAFADVVLAGYEVDGVLAAFVRAEHRHPAVRRFVLVTAGTPIAAAGMTVHGDVAVFGGASTLRAHRGRGAQSRLLRHRLGVAADAGCVLAVATAAPDSVSARNLSGAGFRLHRMSAWR
ncbi:GNAT family N-acetyltransferase [Actinophytocola oryzae]|uniref:N-acetyltransferase domain-containing protein n=1 Tax=Actinophytocola oryzae TaxID=502181 RepID=A0A4R7W4P4_9PSEU|nr:GNAT family N-acetyltransferase [Actinophytocola oryzae]TDV57683.1 hypothetical protein CLV71_101556 [Actinophytocola oryzae]